jgi:hypothetical protein
MCGAVENRWTGYRQQSQEKKEDQNVNRRIFKTIARKKTCADCRTRGGPGCERVAGPGRVRGSASAASARPAQADQPPGRVHGLGQLSGILPASHLTLPSAIEVNLSKEYVRLPLYPGIAYAGTPMPRRSGTSWRMPPPQAPRTTWA